MSRYRKSSILAIALATSFVAASAVQAADKGAQVVTQSKSIPANPVKTTAYKGEELARQAMITLGQARVIALKAHPGTVTDEELEAEPGGSGLRYSFDIKDAKGTHEVGVDAKTGMVLENKLEGLVHD